MNRVRERYEAQSAAGKVLWWGVALPLIVPFALMLWFFTPWSRRTRGVVVVAFLVVAGSAFSENPPRPPVTGQDVAAQSEPEIEPRHLPTQTASPPATSTPTSREQQSASGQEGAEQRVVRGVIARVNRVIDGDTIEATWNGRTRDIRLIGVDTPETVHPSQPIECYGRAAANFTRKSLEGNAVELEFDVERKDRYGRTLAYVWLGDRMFNRTLIAKGFGQISTYPPNVKYVDRFRRAQRKARNETRGLWASCSGGQSEAERESAGGGGSNSGTNCDPNYQGACIPAYPPDLDCGDVPYTNFRSVGSDPHGFDADGDGIACEA